MSINVEFVWVVTVMLISIRIGAILLMTPLFALGGVPVNVRVLVAFGLSAVIVGALSVPLPSVSSFGQMAIAAVTEAVVGTALAFGVFATFAAFQLAGRILDMQLGFGVATLIDPSTRTHAPLLGTILNLTALALFFAIDGHHLLIRGIAFSIEQIPPGGGLPQIDVTVLIAQFGAMFVYAAALAAPVMITVLLVDVVLAVIARTMPQMNVFIVGLPLKIVVGLMVLAISLTTLSPLFARVFAGLFEGWHQLLAR
jgi:flagellar biosynthetic protein FliR